jgi:HprK-related kinase A
LNVSDLTAKESASLLRSDGLPIEIGPFTFNIRTSLRDLAEVIRRLYADFPLCSPTAFVDYFVQVQPPRSLRRWVAPEAVFTLGGGYGFDPFERRMAAPYFEWGLNWCIANHAHQYLILHAACVERNGNALLISGSSGAGKSTLCAGLAYSGWRLLSDELTLVSPSDVQLTALARPLCLKNESLPIIRALAPAAYISPPATSPLRGTICQLQPPRDSVLRVHERARPSVLAFVEYRAGSPARLEPISKGQAMINAANNSFNYGIVGRSGFDALARMIDAVDCYRFVYGSLSEAIELFDDLARDGDRALAAATTLRQVGSD